MAARSLVPGLSRYISHDLSCHNTPKYIFPVWNVLRTWEVGNIYIAWELDPAEYREIMVRMFDHPGGDNSITDLFLVSRGLSNRSGHETCGIAIIAGAIGHT